MTKYPKTISSICLSCNNLFTRKHNKGRETGKFCNRTCAANYAASNKVVAIIYCECGDQIKTRAKLCKNCRLAKSDASLTLLQLREKYSTSQYHAKIRGNARQIYKTSKRTLSCVQCNYSLHVDICHIKGVNEFDPNTPMYIVNNINNLIAMCKNHHWEFDSGYLVLNVPASGTDPQSESL